MILRVSADGKEYDVTIEAGTLQRAGECFGLSRRILVVTDEGVPPEYAETVRAQAEEGWTYTIPSGEASKDLHHFEEILKTLLTHGFTRKDAVVSVGGGVPGDLAAFAASCYMRGIDFYNVPTTLVAMADASVGGKTAVDLLGVKNAAGSFSQPSGVLCDPETLRTLPPREFAAGMAEIVKAALVGDAALFDLIERSGSIQEDLTEIIERALRVKIRVISEDPRDLGARRCLNFGHTLGHGYESAAEGALLHGEAVALGMIPMCSEEVRSRLVPVLQKLGLPVRTEIAASAVMPYVLHDKKKNTSSFTTVFVDKIGSFEFREMSEEELSGRIP